MVDKTKEFSQGYEPVRFFFCFAQLIRCSLSHRFKARMLGDRTWQRQKIEAVGINAIDYCFPIWPVNRIKDRQEDLLPCAAHISQQYWTLRFEFFITFPLSCSFPSDRSLCKARDCLCWMRFVFVHRKQDWNLVRGSCCLWYCIPLIFFFFCSYSLSVGVIPMAQNLAMELKHGIVAIINPGVLVAGVCATSCHEGWPGLQLRFARRFEFEARAFRRVIRASTMEIMPF